MKTKKEIHICDGCGKMRKLGPLPAGQRNHYCDCNPAAPFYMVPLSVKRATAIAINRFRHYPRHVS